MKESAVHGCCKSTALPHIPFIFVVPISICSRITTEKSIQVASPQNQFHQNFNQNEINYDLRTKLSTVDTNDLPKVDISLRLDSARVSLLSLRLGPGACTDICEIRRVQDRSGERLTICITRTDDIHVGSHMEFASRIWFSPTLAVVAALC